MICSYSIDRAARYHPNGAALVSGGRRTTFRELHDRVAGIAASLISFNEAAASMPRKEGLDTEFVKKKEYASMRPRHRCRGRRTITPASGRWLFQLQ